MSLSGRTGAKSLFKSNLMDTGTEEILKFIKAKNPETLDQTDIEFLLARRSSLTDAEIRTFKLEPLIKKLEAANGKVSGKQIAEDYVLNRDSEPTEEATAPVEETAAEEVASDGEEEVESSPKPPKAKSGKKK